MEKNLHEMQLQIESDMLDLGVSRYRSNLNFNVERGQPTSSGGAASLTANCVAGVAEAIRNWIEEIASKGRGRRAEAFAYIRDFEPETLAYVSVRITLDRVLSRGGATLTQTASQIGSYVEGEFRLREFAKDHPALVNEALKNIESRSRNVNYRRTVLTMLMNKHDQKWDRWSEKARLHVGMLLIELLVSAWPVVDIYTAPAKRPGWAGEQKLRATQAALDWIAQEDERRELLSPIALPMVVPPLPWTSPTEGGYLTEAVRYNNPILRAYDRGERMKLLDRADLSEVYRAANAVQETPWQINGRVLDVMQEVWERGQDTGLLPLRDPAELPARPADIDTNPDALKAWKREAAETYNQNAKSVSKRLGVARTLDVAQRFRDFEAIYFCVQCDFRGRFYTIGSGPNVQGADFQRALLTFAKGKRIGDGTGPGWLAIAGANAFGVDKVSFEERIQWVADHQERILATAADPLADLWWGQADMPWMFLAFVFEWAAYVEQGADFVTTLPCYVDGSSNGLQHFSAMLRDPVGGLATNLVPSAKPQDIYGKVAAAVIAKDPTLAGIVDRSVCKRPVMTLPYGSTFNSCRKYVKEALVKNGHTLEKEEITRIASLVWESIGDVVVAARVGMGFIRKLASTASKKKQHVVWTAPSGWPVMQQYRDMKLNQVACMLFGERIRLVSYTPLPDTVDARRSGQGLSPNLVHSLDAAALVAMVNLCLDQGEDGSEPEGPRQFAVIHDSFGTLAPDMDMLGACVRHSFVEMYTHHQPLAELRENIVKMVGSRMAAGIPPVPASGNLDLNLVLGSDFFFA